MTNWSKPLEKEISMYKDMIEDVERLATPLLPLSASLREMPDEHTYSKALIAAPIAASQENHQMYRTIDWGRWCWRWGEKFSYGLGLGSHLP